MRILIVTQHWFPDALGGAYRVARDQAVGLAQAGHDVTVCALGVVGKQEGKSREHGVTLYRYGYKTARMFGMTAATLWCLPSLVRMLKKQKKFDRVIAHDPFSADALTCAGVETPILYVFHASVAKEAAIEGLSRARSGLKKILAPLLLKIFIKKTARLEARALKKAAAIVVFSQYAEQVLIDAYPDITTPGFIAPMGIDTNTFAPPSNRNQTRRDAGMQDNRFYFVTTSRLTPRMGMKELIAAMAMVHAIRPEARLIIAGDGLLRGALHHDVLSRELDGIIQFVGTLHGEELVSLYQGADCFVLPTQAFETFGLSTVEALSAGLPVIGTPVGATPEILEHLDSSLVIAGTNPKAIAEAMLAFMKRSYGERIELSEAAREYAIECFGMRGAIQALTKIVAQL